jgi:hypothetical protein
MNPLRLHFLTERKLLKDQTMRPYLLLLLIPFLFAMTEKPSSRAEDPKKEAPRTGGPCEYHRYEGRAEITSFRKTVDPYSQGKESWEVKFRFIPNQEIKESFAQVADREFLLEINQSSYLSPKQIDKFGIQKGRFLDCTFKVIVRGTCTPILFEFPALSSSDKGEGE